MRWRRGALLALRAYRALRALLPRLALVALVALALGSIRRRRAAIDAVDRRCQSGMEGLREVGAFGEERGGRGRVDARLLQVLPKCRDLAGGVLLRAQQLRSHEGALRLLTLQLGQELGMQFPVVDPIVGTRRARGLRRRRRSRRAAGPLHRPPPPMLGDERLRRQRSRIAPTIHPAGDAANLADPRHRAGGPTAELAYPRAAAPPAAAPHAGLGRCAGGRTLRGGTEPFPRALRRLRARSRGPTGERDGSHSIRWGRRRRCSGGGDVGRWRGDWPRGSARDRLDRSLTEREGELAQEE